MNPEQAVEDLRFRLLQLLTPFGWEVRGRPVMEMHFGTAREVRVGAHLSAVFVVRDRASLCFGRLLRRELEIPARALGEPKWSANMVDRFARECVLGAMNEFSRAEMPTPDQPDWRTTDTTPEDFYAR